MFSPLSIFIDFALISVLLIVSHLLRSKVTLLQRIYMPSSLIAGFIGLIGGWQILKVIPFSMKPDGLPYMSVYPHYLVALLFATLFLGIKKNKLSLRRVLHDIGDTFFLNLGAIVGQYGIALLFGMIVLTPLFSELPSGFAIILPAGFVGGHGTATAIGGILQQHGWEDALSLGYVSATIGLFSGIIGGMILINIATRKRWTRIVRTANELPQSMLSGFVPEDERLSLGKETVSPVALDPFTWHFALMMTAFGVGYAASKVIKNAFPGKYEIPLFALALIAGVLVQKSLDGIKLGHYVDKKVMNRIGSWVTDYLIAFGIASIKISILGKYALPMTLLFLLGLVFCVVMTLVIGKKLFHNFWFERSIFVFGWTTGVVAMGVTLLRVVDPDFKSRVLEDFGFAYAFISIIEVSIIAALPVLVANGITLFPTIILIGGLMGCLLLSRYLIGWFPQKGSELREGEREIIREF